jgi:hypothetical protein
VRERVRERGRNRKLEKERRKKEIGSSEDPEAVY